MKKLLIILLIIPNFIFAQKEPSKFKQDLKKTFKFSTFYGDNKWWYFFIR